MYNANGGRPELPGQRYNSNGSFPFPAHAELQGQQMYGQAQPPNRPELYGQAYGGHPQPGGPYGHPMYAQQPVYQADSRPVPQRPELMGWQAGPVQGVRRAGRRLLQRPRAARPVKQGGSGACRQR